MNWDPIGGTWMHFTGPIKEPWGQVTDDDLWPAVVDETILDPLRFVPVATWASNARSAVALNGNGEILVFHDKKLAFARRQGRWGYFALETIVTSLAAKAPVTVSISEVRETLYRSWLDVSFARGGSCTGAINKDVSPSDTGIVSEGHVRASSTLEKVTCLRRILGEQPVLQNLDTRLRQEIVALDGAMVLTLEWKLLAPGAMMRIAKAGSSGAPRVAAKAMSGGGIGIKVSHDGYMQVFADAQQGRLICFG